MLLSASFPLCLASLDRLSQLSTAAREQVRAWSPPRVLSTRAEKGTLQHLQVAVPMARTLPLASSLLTTTAASCLRPDLARSPRRQLSFTWLRPIIHFALIISPTLLYQAKGPLFFWRLPHDRWHSHLTAVDTHLPSACVIAQPAGWLS